MKRKKQNNQISSILDLISEAGMLKMIQRSGWSVLGIKNAETVADHSFRCTVIGYLLAHLEKVDINKVLEMALFNDLHEARITDLHKMAQRYIDATCAEDKSFTKQISSLPNKIKHDLSQLRKEYRSQKTKESIIVRDADILECLIQAREYQLQGFTQAAKFMKKAPRHLKTKSARSLWQVAKKTDLNQWWFKLSEFKRL